MRTSPSRRARELVHGAFDTHVHVAPDVVQRRIDDISLAKRFAEVGLSGFVLKSHYTSTVERAAVVERSVPGVKVLGAITLNSGVGGLNPIAVELAAREGVRVVWFPTVDSVNQRNAREVGSGARRPVWIQVHEDLRGLGIPMDPIAVLDPDGDLLPTARATLTIAARHGLALATGHLGRDDTFAVVDAGMEQGVPVIVVTHPDFPSQRLGISDQVALAERGALLERCLTTPLTGKVSWQAWIRNIRATGAAHNVLSSDLGQVFNPPVEDGLALAADRLLEAGFAESDIHTMAVENTKLVAEGRGIAA